MDLSDTSARSILDLAAAVERDERRIKLALLSLARAGDGRAAAQLLERWLREPPSDIAKDLPWHPDPAASDPAT